MKAALRNKIYKLCDNKKIPSIICTILAELFVEIMSNLIKEFGKFISSILLKRVLIFYHSRQGMFGKLHAFFIKHSLPFNGYIVGKLITSIVIIISTIIAVFRYASL